MLAPLRHVRVWRFSLYYAAVFGAYVALAAWLPKYYVENFDIPLREAALLTAIFIFPASLLRPVGPATPANDPTTRPYDKKRTENECRHPHRW